MARNNRNRKRDLLQLLLVLAAVALFNLISTYWFFRWDLTAEKRYTISPVTVELMKQLDKEVMVKIYLGGDLTVDFQRLSRATREMLDEVGRFSGATFTYEMIDPLKQPQALSDLKDFGLNAVPVFDTEADGRKTQFNIYPYAIFGMGGYQVSVSLLDNLSGRSGVENLNSSMESLEYKVVDAIRRLKTDETPSVAFLEGQSELDELDVYDITEALSQYFQVDRGVLGRDAHSLDNYKVVIVAKPQTAFSEKDKLILDQYIMRGGRVLWLVDAVNVTLDSLRHASETVGLATDINISDMLFRYGVRINPELVQDVQAALIPVNVSQPGEKAQLEPMPWMFNPLLNTNLQHPVTRNVNVVKTEFASSIDTVGENDVTKTILLQTGRFSRRMPVPVFISLAMVSERPVPEAFNQSGIPVAVALEGHFQSLFANRPIPPGVDFSSEELMKNSKATRMIVVADGDVIRNEVRQRHGAQPQAIPLGYDELSHQMFGNKQFVVNAVNYLADDEGWMALRNRSYELRLLNREVLANSLTFWKWFNVSLPLMLLLILGVVLPLRRRYKYGRKG
ncbi:gliding motility-associated ABC transporter substrate-binding protein GldG [Geofilum sp. OHC36d9]|uniref:gliding motility-associated ABC transporter substrate-binding protein GldG n=1 Tax=Geofilum sp. OHC36d9 TaxID=3458413 RepID=UPI0040341C52